MVKKGGGKLMDIFKTSAASSAGFIFGILPQLLLGVIILIFGLYLINKDKNKKNKENNSHGILFYFGIVLIVLGSVISLNLAFGIDIIIDQFN